MWKHVVCNPNNDHFYDLVLCSADEHLTSYAEFTVQKLSARNPDPTRRTLCLTETCLVERDPATYNVVTCKPLCDVRLICAITTVYRLLNTVGLFKKYLK